MSEEETRMTADEIFGDNQDVSEEVEEESIEEEEIEIEEGEEPAVADENEEKLYTVKVDGEERQVTEDELLKSYSYHGHNVARAQELGKREEELARAEARLKAQEEEIVKMYNERKTSGGESYSAGSDDDDYRYLDETSRGVLRKIDSRIAQLENDLSGMRQSEVQRRQMSVREQVDNTIENFKDKHPDMTEDQVASVVKRLLDSDAILTPETMEMSYKAGLDIGAIEKKAIAEYQKSKKKDAEKVGGSSGGGKVNEEVEDVASMTDKQRRARMVKIFGG